MFEDAVKPLTRRSDETPSGTRIIHDPLAELPNLAGMTPAVNRPVMMDAGDVEADDFTDYYGFSENPFGDSVNPTYFYRTDLHDETCIRMKLAIRHKISLGMVTGPSGTGKTLVSQMILKELDRERYEVALILATPSMSKTAMLKEILNELSLPIPDGPILRTQDLLKVLQDHIMDVHRQGRRLVMLFDECHFLSADSLHMIRTISNIETAEEKLSTCLLFAEDRLLKRLKHPSYESLRNRMYLRAELEPLSLRDAEQYLKFRLMVAGASQEVFTYDAIVTIHELSGGICRQINKLAMLSLINGFVSRRRLVDEETVHICAKQL